jgi:hypothetical protein
MGYILPGVLDLVSGTAMVGCSGILRGIAKKALVKL